MNLGLRADVDAARGFVDDQHLRIRRQPFGQHHLLLVTARQAADRIREAARAQLEPRGPLACTPPLGLAVHQQAAPENVQDRQIGVALNRHLHHQALLAAVLGHQSKTCGHRRLWAERRDDVAADLHLAGVGIDAEDGPRHLAAPGPHQPGQRHDLARAHLKVHVLEEARAAQAAHLQHDGPGHLLTPRVQVAQISPDHLAHHAVRGVPGHAAARHPAAVSQHGHALALGKHLFQPVGDEQHRRATFTQAAHHPEQPLGFEQRQGGGGFVHHQNARTERQRLGDLDQLLVGDAQAAHQPAWVQLNTEVAQDARHRRVLGAGVDAPEAAQRLPPHQHVLGHREVGKEGRLLIDDGHARPLRVAGAAKVLRLTRDAQFTAIGPVDAGQDLDQRGLACPVLAQQRVGLAGIEVQTHPVQGLHRPETLAGRSEGQKGLGRFSTCSGGLPISQGETPPPAEESPRRGAGCRAP